MGYLYVIEDGIGRVKIGRSRFPQDRIHVIKKAVGLGVVKEYISEDLDNFGEIENIMLGEFRDGSKNGEWVNYEFGEIVRYAKKLINYFGISSVENGKNKTNGNEIIHQCINSNMFELFKHTCEIRNIDVNKAIEYSIASYIKNNNYKKNTNVCIDINKLREVL